MSAAPGARIETVAYRSPHSVTVRGMPIASRSSVSAIRMSAIAGIGAGTNATSRRTVGLRLSFVYAPSARYAVPVTFPRRRCSSG